MSQFTTLLPCSLAMDRLSLPPGNLRPYCAVALVGVSSPTSPPPGLESKALLIFEVKGLLPSLPFPFFSYWWFESLWVLRLQGARWGALLSSSLTPFTEEASRLDERDAAFTHDPRQE